MGGGAFAQPIGIASTGPPLLVLDALLLLPVGPELLPVTGPELLPMSPLLVLEPELVLALASDDEPEPASVAPGAMVPPQAPAMHTRQQRPRATVRMFHIVVLIRDTSRRRLRRN